MELASHIAPSLFKTWKVWKSFTTGSFSTLTVQPNNETSITQINFVEFLEFKMVLLLDRDSYAYLKEELLGPVDEKISLNIVQEAICELLNLNFFDMFEVEYCRTYNPPQDIYKWMHPVLGTGMLYCPVPIP